MVVVLAVVFFFGDAKAKAHGSGMFSFEMLSSSFAFVLLAELLDERDDAAAGWSNGGGDGGDCGSSSDCNVWGLCPACNVCLGVHLRRVKETRKIW